MATNTRSLKGKASDTPTTRATRKTGAKVGSKQKPESKPNRRSTRTQAHIRAETFWNSSFMDYEGVRASDNPEEEFSNLDNPIHLIFKEENWGNVDYEVMEPSLRLATLLLEAPPVQPFLSTLINRKRLFQLKTTHPNGNKMFTYSAEDSVRPLNDPISIRKALKNLASMVHFRYSARLDGASTDPQDDWMNGAFPGGRGSIIKYSLNAYRVLRDATYAKDGDLVFLLSCQFEFGLLSAHEVCHALVNAVEGDLDIEPFFHGALVSEIGYAFESVLFGGHLTYVLTGNSVHDDEWSDGQGPRRHWYPDDDHFSELRGILVMWEWPYRSIINSYRQTGEYIGVRNEDQIPVADLAWRVNSDFASKFLTKEFWEDDVRRLGAAAFQPPKEVGHFFLAHEDGEIQPHRPGRDLLPAGYRFGARGVVVPI